MLQSHLSFWAAHQRYCLLQWCSQTWRGRTGLPRQCGVTDGSPAFPSALRPGCERKQMKMVAIKKAAPSRQRLFVSR